MYTVAVSIIVIDEQNLMLLFVLVKYKKYNISAFHFSKLRNKIVQSANPMFCKRKWNR